MIGNYSGHFLRIAEVIGATLAHNLANYLSLLVCSLSAMTSVSAAPGIFALIEPFVPTVAKIGVGLVQNFLGTLLDTHSFPFHLLLILLATIIGGVAGVVLGMIGAPLVWIIRLIGPEIDKVAAGLIKLPFTQNLFQMALDKVPDLVKTVMAKGFDAITAAFPGL